MRFDEEEARNLLQQPNRVCMRGKWGGFELSHERGSEMDPTPDEAALIRNIEANPGDLVGVYAYMDWLTESITDLATCPWCNGTRLEPPPRITNGGLVFTYVGRPPLCSACHGAGYRSNRSSHETKLEWLKQLVASIEQDRADALRIASALCD